MGLKGFGLTMLLYTTRKEPQGGTRMTRVGQSNSLQKTTAVKRQRGTQVESLRNAADSTQPTIYTANLTALRKAEDLRLIRRSGRGGGRTGLRVVASSPSSTPLNSTSLKNSATVW